MNLDGKLGLDSDSGNELREVGTRGTFMNFLSHALCHRTGNCTISLLRTQIKLRKEKRIFLAIGNYKRGFFQSVASAKNGCTNTDSENWRGVEGHSLPRAVSDPSPERNWVNSQSNSSLSLHYHLMSCCYLLLQIFSHFSLYMFVIKV